MAGKLSDKYMDTLERWIGTGPKTFTLLYSITKDGCNAKTFHQKCDNRGPTVTVLYNQSMSIYGGYTSHGWASRNGYVNDDSAFLFELQLNGQPAEMRFSSYGRGAELYDLNNCGPIFGTEPHDLFTFSGTINKREGIFLLNGRMFPGSSYRNDTVKYSECISPLTGRMSLCSSYRNDTEEYSEDILPLNGRMSRRSSKRNRTEKYSKDDFLQKGNMAVTELEVYKVADGTRKPKVTDPWRKSPSWNKKLRDELTKEIVAFKPLGGLEISNARLVMIGPVGAGKSSFFNTIDSILKGRITQKAGSGSAEQSLTTKYTPYKVRLRNGTPLNFCLCDTQGLEDGQGMDVIECSYLLEGNVPDFYEFNPARPINAKTKGFITSPTIDDRPHGVIFVLDATTLDVLSANVLQKIKEFQKLFHQKELIQTLLLTKVDKLCEHVSTDVSLTYSSTFVEAAVDKASNLLGIPRLNIWPVKNYEKELDLDENVSILALLALRQILRFTEDYMENMFDTLDRDGAVGGSSGDY